MDTLEPPSGDDGTMEPSLRSRLRLGPLRSFGRRQLRGFGGRVLATWDERGAAHDVRCETAGDIPSVVSRAHLTNGQ